MSADLRTAAVAALAVLAVAFAAATLGSTVAPEPQGLGGGAADGSGSAPAGGAPPAEEPPLGSPVPSDVVTAIVLVALLAVLAYALRNRRVAVRALLVGAVAAAFLVVLADLLPTPGRLPEPTAIGAGNGSAPPLGGSASAPVTPSSVLALVGLAVALVAVLVLLGRSGGGDENERVGGVGTGDGDDAAAVGRAAGRAADRIEAEASAENEVYRAWREMTGLLDVESPETSTAGEFAGAAVEAGLGREDVAELTRLFEDVRYGDRDPSTEYERRAVAVFRRIEDRYTEDEP
jgi:hypothetical protein